MIQQPLEILTKKITTSLNNNQIIELINEYSKKTNILDNYFYGINNDLCRRNNSVIDDITHHLGNSIFILSGSIRSLKRKNNKINENYELSDNLNEITKEAINLENYLKQIKNFRKNYLNKNKPQTIEDILTTKEKPNTLNDNQINYYLNYIQENLNDKQVIELTDYLLKKPPIHNYFFGLTDEENSSYKKIIKQSVFKISESIKTMNNKINKIKQNKLTQENYSKQTIDAIIKQIKRLDEHQKQLNNFYNNGCYFQEYDAPEFLKHTYLMHKKTNNGSSIDLKINDNAFKCPVYVDQESLMISMQRIFNYLSKQNAKINNELIFDIENKDEKNYFVAKIKSPNLNIEKPLSECMRLNIPNPYNGLSKVYNDLKQQEGNFDITPQFPYGSLFKISIPLHENITNKYLPKN
jgi:hypothetical protein